jgi:methenyltetrahydrofolate cyclohydrolase
MVVNLSVGKKSYEALDESIKQEVAADFETVRKLSSELMELVEEDTRAFNSYMEAMKLPKETEEERASRADRMQKATEYALKVPLTVTEKCLSLLKHQLIIARHGNKNAVSDVGVGALLAFAALEGAALNVEINLAGMKHGSMKAEAVRKMKDCLMEGKQLKQEVMELIHERIRST